MSHDGFSKDKAYLLQNYRCSPWFQHSHRHIKHTLNELTIQKKLLVLYDIRWCITSKWHMRQNHWKPCEMNACIVWTRRCQMVGVVEKQKKYMSKGWPHRTCHIETRAAGNQTRFPKQRLSRIGRAGGSEILVIRQILFT